MSMFIRNAILATTLATASIFACSQSGSSNGVGQAVTGVDDDGGEGGSATDAGACPPVPSLAVCSDGQAAAIFLAASKGEVDLATAVSSRLTDASAKAFAQRIIQDHTALNSALSALLTSTNITPVEGGLSTAITESTRNQIQALSTKTGAELDRAYIDHEILGHLGTLGVGDHLLGPSIQNAQLAAAATTARTVIATHVQLALDVQKTLEGACGSGGGDGGAATDGGASTDGGETTDGGEASDAGTTTDGGETTDAGTSTDGGGTTDAGTSTDGGGTTDAGTGSTTL